MSVSATPGGAASAAVDRWPVLAATAAFVAGAAVIADAFGLRQAALLVLGGFLGVALYHAAFGFTGGWRRFIVERRGQSLRAQLVMIALATTAMLPLVEGGAWLGQPVVAAVAPVGASVFIGAFLFGLGMQLGGGCGSGTLFTLGGGSTRMLITLALFIAGAVIATSHLHWWLALPGIGSVSLSAAIGLAPAIFATLAALAVLAWVSLVLERRRHGEVQRAFDGRAGAGKPLGERLVHGPWPLIWGAAALAAGNAATLLIAGHPWSITYGLGLWGAKIGDALGLGVAGWPFWQAPAQAEALRSSVLADTVSVMNFGLVLGAMAAAGLAGRYAPKARVPVRSALAAVIGGLLMGYGARLAFGCNIGALFSGIATGSLHGWLWLAAGFAGSVVGVRLRPYFGLSNR